MPDDFEEQRKRFRNPLSSPEKANITRNLIDLKKEIEEMLKKWEECQKQYEKDPRQLTGKPHPGFVQATNEVLKEVEEAINKSKKALSFPEDTDVGGFAQKLREIPFWEQQK